MNLKITASPKRNTIGTRYLGGFMKSGVAIMALVAAATLSSQARAQDATMEDLGTLPGGTSSYANAVNANGTVVVGHSSTPDGGRAFRWTSTDGMVSLGTLPGGTGSAAWGVNVDGSVIVGHSSTPNSDVAIRWTSGGGMVSLGTLAGGNSSRALGVNADGSVVVGYSGSTDGMRAFRWTSSGGMVSLGTLTGGGGSYVNFASAVNADGSVVVGSNGSTEGTRAFRWTSADGMVSLGTLTGGTQSAAAGVNADGAVVVGWSGSADGSRAFRWTSGGGMVSLGTLTGGTYSYAWGVNADGSVVVGSSGSEDANRSRAFRWTAADGMVNLGTLTGGNTSYANAVNADGSVVVGYSNSTNGTRAFIWRGVMQDYTNLLASFPLLASATEVAMWQNAGWLAQFMDGGCEIAEGRKACVSVRGAAGNRNSVANDGSWSDKNFGLTSLSLGVALGDHAMAGLIVGGGAGGKGDIVAMDGSLFGLGGYLRWSETGDYKNGINLRSNFGWSHGKATSMRGVGLTDVETARANANINAVSASAEASYGVAVGSAWLVSPQIGFTWQRVTRSAYSESSDLVFSAGYDRAKAGSLTLTFGLEPEWTINDSNTLQLRFGGEHDLHVDNASLTGTSNVPGAESFDLASDLARHDLRGEARLTHVLKLAPGAMLRTSVQANTPVYGSKIWAAASIAVGISF